MLQLPYLALESKIKSIINPDTNLLAFKDVAYFNNQYDIQAPENQIMDTPAVYIQFQPASFMSDSAQSQYLTLNFALHLLTNNTSFKPAENENSLFPGERHYKLLQLLYKNIQNYAAKFSDLPGQGLYLNTKQDFQVINSCNRIGIEPLNDLGLWVVTVLNFQTLAFDPMASPFRNLATASASLNIEVNLP